MLQKSEDTFTVAQGNTGFFRWFGLILVGENPVSNWLEMMTPLPSQSDMVPVLGRIDLMMMALEERRQKHVTDDSQVHDPCLLWEAERIGLFETGPGGVPAPPYGSWWMDGQIMGDSTAEVAAFYRREGLSPEGGPADFLSTELEFLLLLILNGQQKPNQSTTPPTGVMARQAQFMDKFMLPWVLSFCIAGKKAARTEFWWNALQALQSMFGIERNRLRQCIGV